MSYEKGDRDRADPCKIYVGGNPEMEEDELRGLFAKHGTVEKVWIARSPPGFAFVWLTDERDVADAIKALDGAELGHVRTHSRIQPVSRILFISKKWPLFFQNWRIVS